MQGWRDEIGSLSEFVYEENPILPSRINQSQATSLSSLSQESAVMGEISCRLELWL